MSKEENACDVEGVMSVVGEQERMNDGVVVDYEAREDGEKDDCSSSRESGDENGRIRDER